MSRWILLCVLLGGVALSSPGQPPAKQKKKAAPPRPPLTDELRMQHIPTKLAPSPRLADEKLEFQTVDDTVVVEAEHFTAQRRDHIRRWYIASRRHDSGMKPDPDPVMPDEAGGGAYVENLPDTFVTENDRPIDGLNIGSIPGAIAVLHYKVHFAKAGRYYLWARIRSNDEEDNTLHIGIDDTWPASGNCLQFPKHTKQWQWGQIVRVEVPNGDGKRAYLDVPKPGLHTVQFSMREDGMEFDRFILSLNRDYPKPEGVGPAPTAAKAGELPKPIPVTAEPPAKPAAKPAAAGTFSRGDQPLVKPDFVVKEVDGRAVVEAECFVKQTLTEKRAWHITTKLREPRVLPDIDGSHADAASLGAYVEVLPDTGINGGKLKAGESISDKPGELAVLHYAVNFTRPGKYFIWARAFGTDGDDNTLHFGLDGGWPESSARMHTFGGQKWQWACRHRQHKGKVWLTIDTPGVHIITLSMREDGCELDQFLLTLDENETPKDGPATMVVDRGQLPAFAGLTPGVFREKDGLVVVELESHTAADGWEFQATDGIGSLTWTKPGQGRKPGEGVLAYTIRIETAGHYQFFWRSKMPDPTNRPDTLDPDGNDTWLRFVGGTDVSGQAKLGDGWKKVAILGHPAGWTWNTNADGGPPHPLTPVCRAFAPGVYRVELCGRSHGHAIDRFLLRRYDGDPIRECTAEQEAHFAKLPASDTEGHP